MTLFYVMANLARGKEKASTLFAPQLDICCILNHKAIELSRPGGKQFPAMPLPANQTALDHVLER